MTELATLNLPLQHSRRAIQEKYNRARETFLNEELKGEIDKLKAKNEKIKE
jgi:hypothetical protein